ncbi:Mitochondrial import inner membrane translocase subunit TIM9 [Tolypocladium ophioglossoides CBS 100239]|uniref:Mitochondrial import inner membrane translocase subunit TIM9 n=1 Tax=Tolypocladium ophioglossoides (strain CBS 100239) TaxID=1163406 RepID=A0A0L0NE92_TOLOC|nr:Mitochondrial import inner membrane translocase subunit TIM9 [Tolypocladium ophioglossoides CBS 100239]
MDMLTSAEQRTLEQRMQKRQVKEFMGVRRPLQAPTAHTACTGRALSTRRLRRPRRALLHQLRRRLHLQGPLVARKRLHQPLRSQVDGHPAARQRPIPGAQRPDHPADAEQIEQDVVVNSNSLGGCGRSRNMQPTLRSLHDKRYPSEGRIDLLWGSV